MKKRATGNVVISKVLIIIALLVAVTIGLHAGRTHTTAQRFKKQVASAARVVKQQPSQCASNTVGKLLLVSIAQQHLWACNGVALIKQSAVTTGGSHLANGVNDSTPFGTWRIYEKFRNLDLKGSDASGSWNDYVQYWMPFDGAVGFHDASWQTFPFGSGQYVTGGSHGCVQLPTNVAAWLYGWAPVGTAVTIEA